MSILKAKSQVIISSLSPAKADVNPLFDAISQVLSALIQLLRDKCNKTPANALAEAKSGTIQSRLEIRRAIKNSIGRQRRYQFRLETSVQNELRNTTVEEMHKLYTEVPGPKQILKEFEEENQIIEEKPKDNLKLEKEEWKKENASINFS